MAGWQGLRLPHGINWRPIGDSVYISGKKKKENTRSLGHSQMWEVPKSYPKRSVSSWRTPSGHVGTGEERISGSRRRKERRHRTEKYAFASALEEINSIVYYDSPGMLPMYFAGWSPSRASPRCAFLTRLAPLPSPRCGVAHGTVLPWALHCPYHRSLVGRRGESVAVTQREATNVRKFETGRVGSQRTVGAVDPAWWVLPPAAGRRNRARSPGGAPIEFTGREWVSMTGRKDGESVGVGGVPRK